jgi:2,3-bisphosphoglycerate-independent phosphoglycerate mutase
MTLSEQISHLGKKQLKIAETEKYAHVTYFFNGGKEQPFKGEERILVNSPKEVATYDLKPEMSAPLILEKLLNKLEDETISLFVVNFANPDMVGHTGNYEATIKAMETIDHCVKKLSEKCIEKQISMLITADHGNADQMVYPDGSINTSHSEADVPFCLVTKAQEANSINIKAEDRALKDIAPTILHLLGIEQNNLMVGETIFS